MILKCKALQYLIRKLSLHIFVNIFYKKRKVREVVTRYKNH